MDTVGNLPELDGACALTSGVEPGSCYCQGQGRYATECLSRGECTQRERNKDPGDASLLWRGPPPPHIRRHVIDDVRALAVVRGDGADPCAGAEEKTFCARHDGGCAFSIEREKQGFKAAGIDTSPCSNCADDAKGNSHK